MMMAQHQTEAAEQAQHDQLDDDMGVPEQPPQRQVVRALSRLHGVGWIHGVWSPRAAATSGAASCPSGGAFHILPDCLANLSKMRGNTRRRPAQPPEILSEAKG